MKRIAEPCWLRVKVRDGEMVKLDSAEFHETRRIEVEVDACGVANRGAELFWGRAGFTTSATGSLAATIDVPLEAARDAARRGMFCMAGEAVSPALLESFSPPQEFLSIATTRLNFWKLKQDRFLDSDLSKSTDVFLGGRRRG